VAAVAAVVVVVVRPALRLTVELMEQQETIRVPLRLLLQTEAAAAEVIPVVAVVQVVTEDLAS
jgi:hypothetical protein